MPATQIDIRMQYSIEQEQQLLNAVFDAIQQSFQLPRYDRNIRSTGAYAMSGFKYLII